MNKANVKLTIYTVLCFGILAGLTGCSSSKGFLGYLRFWEPRDETPAKEQQASQASSFMSQVRSARGNPHSHYRLAVYYQLQGRDNEAIHEFTKTLEIDPGYVSAYNGMGVSYDNLKEFDKAREAYFTAIQLAPDEYYAYNNLGYSFILTREYEESVEILKEGISLNGGNEQMRNNLATAYAALGDRNLAIAELQRTNKQVDAELAFERIQEQLDVVKSRNTLASASPGISSENMVPTPSTNRFVKRMTKSLNAAKKARVKTAGPRTVTLKVAKMKPDFIKIAEPTTQKVSVDPAKKFLQKLFMIEPTGRTINEVGLEKKQQIL